ncbi:MAG TPA: hypothetical protein DIT65_01630 [Cryomorphaceae bacterium]|nr:hypothetical protein [Cryomorphaceae bacterium]|tara:strand:- start:518 stop:1306 length:789 start_codon:yes stop_codon:yes gene_type:complete
MQQLILFLSRYRNNLLLIALLLLAVIRHSFKNPVSEHWVNTVGTGLAATFTDATNGWKTYWSLEKVNDELARENAILKAAMKSNIAPEFAASAQYNYIPAKVIDHSYKKVNNYIIINAGNRLGVQPGMGVVSAEGWVGTVSESTRNYAYVLPFTHSKGDIGARIEGKGLGQLSWSGPAQIAILTDVEREFQPQPGDSVYSYTRTEIAPPVLMGIVQSAQQSDEDLSWSAIVNLTTDFMNMDWIYICQFKGKQELDSLKLEME